MINIIVSFTRMVPLAEYVVSDQEQDNIMKIHKINVILIAATYVRCTIHPLRLYSWSVMLSLSLLGHYYGGVKLHEHDKIVKCKLTSGHKSIWFD